MLLSVEEAAKILGISKSTLRRWEAEGRLKPERTPGGHRRYRSEELMLMASHPVPDRGRVTIVYARVLNRDQKDTLERQAMMLSEFCTQHGWTYEVIRDFGSGLDYDRTGLRELLRRIMRNEVERLVIAHKDRLLRFGTELVFSLCEEFQTEVVLTNQSDEICYDEELTQDVREIITIFAARLYSSRSRQNKELIERLNEAVQDDREGENVDPAPE